LNKAKRILIKFGSSLLVNDSTGKVRVDWLKSVAEDVAKLQAMGKDVLVVSSGAIAVGRRDLGFTQTKSSMTLDEKQAAAAVGSIHLAHAYQEVLGAHGIVASQILVTTHDTEDRKRSVNARAAINTLLKKGSVPVINENDATSTTEIKFGDNDRLAARVSTMMGADVCILFSDIDGVYDSDPRSNPAAHHHAFIDRIDGRIEAMASEPVDGDSTGGMVTKVQAAKIATGGGCYMAIAHGNAPNPLGRLMAGERCTWFCPKISKRSAKENWIAGAIRTYGTLTIDPGAEKALLGGGSLLSKGVIGQSGTFQKGDPIEIISQDGRLLGRGLMRFKWQDSYRLLGKDSEEQNELIGYRYCSPQPHRTVTNPNPNPACRGSKELVHRDEMVLGERVQVGEEEFQIKLDY